MSEQADPCGTCFQNIYNCPGHFGHIELPLPTINPLYHKLISLLLRMSCLNCYSIQLPGKKKTINIFLLNNNFNVKTNFFSELFKLILSTQLKLLNCGLITEADEIESTIMSVISEHGSLENLPEDACFSINHYEELIQQRLSEGNNFPTKNSHLLLTETLNNIFKEIKTRKQCMHCKTPMLYRIQSLKNRIMMTTNQVAKRNRFVLRIHFFLYCK